MRAALLGLIVMVSLGVSGLAEPQIEASCPVCLFDDGVLSAPVGTEIVFQVYDSAKPVREVIWLFGDGTKDYGVAVRHSYTRYGKFTVEALIIYRDEVPQSRMLTAHVLVAPPQSGQLNISFREILYTAATVAVLAVLKWLGLY